MSTRFGCPSGALLRFWWVACTASLASLTAFTSGPGVCELPVYTLGVPLPKSKKKTTINGAYCSHAPIRHPKNGARPFVRYQWYVKIRNVERACPIQAGGERGDPGICRIGGVVGESEGWIWPGLGPCLRIESRVQSRTAAGGVVWGVRGRRPQLALMCRDFHGVGVVPVWNGGTPGLRGGEGTELLEVTEAAD